MAPLGAAANSADTFTFFRQFTTAEYLTALSVLPEQLTQAPSVIIDGVEYTSLGPALERLFASRRLDSLKRIFSLETFRHWNLHGGNLIFDDDLNVHLIDPDTNILLHDPLFEIARLYYTAHHDMVEYRSFTIEGTGSDRLAIKYTLNQQQMNNYALLYDLSVGDRSAVGVTDADIPELQTRLGLAYLSCLLRGINANYLEGENDTPEFQMLSTSMYLYLIATQIANQLAEA